jgi:RNA polymerase sigma factor (TIGR02999 family)
VTGPARTSGAITAWLNGWRQGLDGAEDRLMEEVYPHLRRIATRFLAGERSSHTLDPNALVHELWIRMTVGETVTCEDRSHFFALAARTMRRILIDHARTRAAGKRGGDWGRVSLTAVDGFVPEAYDADLLSLNGALSELERADPRAARVVELRFFGGLDGAEIAQVLGVSEITVKRDWRAARAWLLASLSGA